MFHSREARKPKNCPDDASSRKSGKKKKLSTPPKTPENHSMLEGAKVIVGIDFGTTCSGFAYASTANPDEIFTHYHWPCQAEAGEKPYCKTQTSLWYSPGVKSETGKLQDWGWTAQVNYTKEMQDRSPDIKRMTTPSGGGRESVLAATCGHLLTKFKLCLGSNSGPGATAEQLLDGFSAEQLISDYLRQLSVFVMKELGNRFGRHVQKKDVRWCLTVPTIWTETAKQTMIACAQMAGLVCGNRCQDTDASLHPIVLVLEPEAASVYCQQKLKDSLRFRKGSKFLMVDAGGGTVDLVVHEKIADVGIEVKEITCNTGDLCGGTFVDSAFMKYLGRKIGCFDKFSRDYPASLLTIKGYWEMLKCNFDGKRSSSLEVPARLAAAWDAYEVEEGSRSWGDSSCHDEVEITSEDMRNIFDGEVNKILKLIRDQLNQVPKIEAILAVGGFSNSPYLMSRIRDQFSSSVKHIISPADPGSAVCQGAVAFGAHGPGIILSRKSKKTYGMKMFREFAEGDPPASRVLDDSGEYLCSTSFCVFCRIGDDVPVDHSVSQEFTSFAKGDKMIKFSLYTTSDPDPKYVTDKGVVNVGSWTYRIPCGAQNMKDKAAVLVTMHFGRTHVEVSAKSTNFVRGTASMFSAFFERDYLVKDDPEDD